MTWLLICDSWLQGYGDVVFRKNNVWSDPVYLCSLCSISIAEPQRYRCWTSRRQPGVTCERAILWCKTTGCRRVSTFWRLGHCIPHLSFGGQSKSRYQHIIGRWLTTSKLLALAFGYTILKVCCAEATDNKWSRSALMALSYRLRINIHHIDMEYRFFFLKFPYSSFCPNQPKPQLNTVLIELGTGRKASSSLLWNID